MRILAPCLLVLLAALPGLAGAQTLRVPPLAASTAPAKPEEPVGEGCGSINYTGYVKTGEKPFAGASVFVKGTSVVLVTNELGYFVLPATVVRWPTISVSAMGYEPVELTYRQCEPVTVDMKVLPGTKFKKHGRKKGWIVSPKMPKHRR